MPIREINMDEESCDSTNRQESETLDDLHRAISKNRRKVNSNSKMYMNTPFIIALIAETELLRSIPRTS